MTETNLISARKILERCKRSMEQLREIERSKRATTTEPSGFVLTRITVYITDGQECQHLAPWLVLAQDLGVDGIEPLPAEISEERAAKVQEVATYHLACAWGRIEQRTQAWPAPKPDADNYTLRANGEAFLDQAADMSFVAVLTTRRTTQGSARRTTKRRIIRS